MLKFFNYFQDFQKFLEKDFPCLRGSKNFIRQDLIDNEPLRHANDATRQNSRWHIVCCIFEFVSHTIKLLRSEIIQKRYNSLNPQSQEWWRSRLRCWKNSQSRPYCADDQTQKSNLVTMLRPDSVQNQNPNSLTAKQQTKRKL